MASLSTVPDGAQVFDRRAVRLHRDRAAPDFGDHDFLKREICDRLADRLGDVLRAFPMALDLGCHSGEMADVLAGRGGVETMVRADLSPAFARRAGAPAVAADEEALPFRDGSFDLVTSALSLHWANDLPGTLIQIRRALKPDGLFLAALFGGETLFELRYALMQAEAEISGGAGPRVSPFTEIRDAGGLLQRAGFALPVTDCDNLVVTYPHALALMAELRAMGESNAVIGRRAGFTSRSLMTRAAEIYQATFADEEGRIPATFQIIYMTAWSPHESQQRPLRPGAAQTRLADALGTKEKPAGDKTGR